jgi:predicted phage terminase large subunit-like protein
MTEWQLADNLISIGKRECDAYALTDAFEVLRSLDDAEKVPIEDKDGSVMQVFETEKILQIHEKSAAIRDEARKILASSMGSTAKLLELDKRTLLFDAPHNFDAFCQYMEINRETERQFYFPRRPQLYQIARQMERLERKELDRLGISMPPGTGKSELALFYLAWIGGREPDLANLTVSHSHSIVKLMHSELRRLLSPKDEYTWGEIFKGVRRCGVDADLLTVDLHRNKRFATYSFTSLGTSNAGRFRCQHLLYSDDIVPGIEVAMNPEMLEKLYRQYTVDALQRTQGEVGHLMIATRWANRDIMGRLETLNRSNPRALFLNYPVCDSEGKSLFNYPYGLGYTDQQVKELRDSMEDVYFSALYMGEPYEKDGQLYSKDELRRYERLPDREPDGIVAVCDTKSTGGDYCCLPIAYVYGSDYYIEDVVFENYSPDTVENSVVLKLLHHKVQQAQFESNSAGGKMAQVVQERINAGGGITSITTKWTQAHKETKIQMNAPWVKQHCIFRADDLIQGKQWSEYRQFLRQLTSYSMRGKNAHDDAPDAMAQLAIWRTKASNSAKVTLGKRWF